MLSVPLSFKINSHQAIIMMIKVLQYIKAQSKHPSRCTDALAFFDMKDHDDRTAIQIAGEYALS